MKKILSILYSILFFVFCSNAQNPIYFTSGDYTQPNNWSGGTLTSTIVGTNMHTATPNGTGLRYFRFYSGANASGSIYGPSASSVTLTSGAAPITTQSGNATFAYALNIVNASSNVVFKTSNGTPGNARLWATEVQGTIRTMSGSTQIPSIANGVNPGQTVTITRTLSGALPTGQNVYIRYTTNNFTSSTVSPASINGTTATFTIPAGTNTANAVVVYYLFSSGSTTPSATDADLMTINIDNNGGSNYTYTVGAAATTYPYVSAGLGTISSYADYLTNATWQGNLAPTSASNVIISTGDYVNVTTITRNANTTTTVNGNMSISGTMVVPSTSNAVTVTGGSIVVTSTGTYRHNITGNAGGTIPTITWNTGSTCIITGSGSPLAVSPSASSLGQAFHNFTWNLPQTAVINLSGALTTVNGTFSVISTGGRNLRLTTSNGSAYTPNFGAIAFTGGSVALIGSGSFGSNTAVINVSGNVVISDSATVDFNSGSNAGSCTLNIGGNLSMSGTSSIIKSFSATATVNFNKSSGTQTFTQTAGTITATANWNVGTGSSTNTLQLDSNVNLGAGTGTFSVLNNAGIDFQTFVLSGSGTFSAATGATLTSANTSASGALNTSGANGSVQTTTRTFTNTGVNYIFNGASAQVAGTAIGAASINNFTLNNSTGVTLSGSPTITGTLALTSGKLTLGSNNLTLTGASVTGASSSNYIVTNSTGRVLRSIASGGGTFAFPIGRNATNYTPLTITNTGASTSIYTVGAANTTFTPTAIAANAQWSIASSASTTSTLAFQWLTADAGATLGASPTTGIANQYNGSTWDNRGGSTTGTPNVTTVSGITNLTNPIWAVTLPPPTVTTNTASSITTTSVVLNGTVNANASSTVASFDYSTDMSFNTNTVADQSPVIGTSNTSISKTVTGLNTNTLYNYRAKGVNDAGTTNGSNATFTTLSNAPTVGTGDNATAVGFRANWTAPTNDGSESITYRVQVSTNNTNETDFVNNIVTTQAGVTATNYTFTTLSSGTTYYYRVRAENAGGNSTWSAVSAGISTTSSTIATVTTAAISSITVNSASGGGEVVIDGGDAVTERGIVYNTTGTPTTADTKVTSGTGVGTFTANLTSLNSNTTYYVRAYATNGVGTAYGSEVNFTTFAAEPTTQSTVAFGTKTNNSLVVNFTGGNGARRVVFVKQGNAVDYTPTDAVAPSGINSVFGTGTQFGTGNYAVYDGTGTSVTVTGLTKNTTYHIAVYEYNNNSASLPNYFATAGVGNATTYNPTITVGSVTAFGNTVTGTNASSKSYTVSGTELVGSVTITAPTGFAISLDDADFSVNPIVLAKNGSDAVPSTTIYVRFSPSSATGATGSLNITHTSTDATTQNVAVSGNAIATQPDAEGSISFGTVTTTSIVVNLPTVGNGGKRLIIMKAGSAVDANPADATSYTANAAFGSGSQLGTGNYVVYNGTGSGNNVITVIGLTAFTNYHFAVFEYNEGTGTSQNYLTPSGVDTSQQTANVTFSNTAGSSTAFVGSTNNVVYQTNIAVTGNDATFTGVSFTTAGTYQAVDIANGGIKLWYSTNSTFSTGTATQLGSAITSTGSGETLAFTSGISQALVAGSTYYLYVTVDYAADATPARTINITATSTSNYTFSTTVTRSGTSDIGTTQTINGYTTRTWSGTGSSATWLNTANWNTTTIPGTSEIAQFDATTSTGNTVGINMNTAGGSQTVGALEFTNARVNPMTIGNNSGTNGILTINGAVLNSVANVIIRNNSSQLLTLQNNVSLSSTMGVALGNPTNNIIAIDGSGGVTISSIISGASRSLTKNGIGAGALSLSGTNTFSGGFTLNAGTLNINSTAALGTGTFTINGGTISGTNGVFSPANVLVIGADFTFTGSNQISFTNNSTPVELGTSITRTINHTGTTFFQLNSILNGTGTTLAINSTNTGFVVLNGTSNFTGGITVTSSSSGGLSFNATTGMPSTGTITVNNGGVIRFPITGIYGATGQSIILNPNQTTNGVILAPNAVVNAVGRDIAINTDSKINVSNSSGSLTLSGIISGTGKLIKSGAGTLSITGTSNTFSGDVQIDAGTFMVDANNALPTNKNVIVNSGTFRINTNFTQTIQNLDLSGGGNLTIAAGATLIVTGTYTPGSGTINNLGTIVLKGTAVQNFPGSSTIINNGTANTLTNLTIDNSNGVTLDKNFSVAGALALTSGTLTIGANTLTIANNGSIAATSGSIATGSNGGTIAFAGAGTISGTQLTFNNLTIGGANTTTTAPIITGTLQLNAGASFSQAVSYSGSSNTLQYNQGGSVTIGSNEWPTSNGPTSLSITNNTTLSVAADRTLAGNITVATGSDIRNSSGTARTLTLSGAAPTISVAGSITGTNIGVGNDLNLTYSNSTGTLTVSGAGSLCRFLNCTISNAGATLALSRTFEVMFGTFTVNGTLQINSGGSVSSSGVSPTYGSNSTLRYNSGTTYGRFTEWSAVSGAGYPNHVQISNNTTLDLGNGGASTPRQIAGNLIVDNGSTLTLANTAMSAALTVKGNLLNYGTITLSGSIGGDLRLEGNLSDSGVFNANNRAVFFDGANTQEISGNGTFDISYVRIAKTGGSVRLLSNLLCEGPNGGNAMEIDNSGGKTSILDLNGFTLTLGKASTASTYNSGIATPGSIRGSSTSSLFILGTGSFGTINFDATTPGTTNVLQNLTINRTSTGSVTLGSNLTVGAATTFTDGVFDIGSNTLTLNGTVARTNGTVTATSGTVTFNGGSAQSIPASTFTSNTLANLNIPNTNGVTFNGSNAITGTMTVNGLFTPVSSAVISGAGTLTGTGTVQVTRATGTADLSNQYTLNRTLTDLTVEYIGAAAQGVNGITFGGLKISNTNGVNMAGAVTVNGALNLNTGYLSISNNTLTLTGTATGSGFLRGGNTSNVTIGGTGALGTLNFDATKPDTTNVLRDFTVNRSGGSVRIGNALNITRILQPTAGTLNTGGFITLKSTSITNTAIVGIVGVGGTISGNVTAERFIPQNPSRNSSTGIRAYRDISPGLLPNSSIFNQWQESGINNNGYGTQITGQVGTVGQTDATTGMDYTVSGAASLFSYNVTTSTGVPTWDSGIRNTKTTTASPFKGYRIAIRGNRANNLAVNISGLNAPATLRNTGTLITGDVTFNTTGVTANGSTNTNIQLARNTDSAYTLIANPYWCPINWSTIANRNTNISPTYWVWNPNIGTSGGYVTYNAATNTSNNSGAATNRNIQPGQAFFVRNVNTNPSITITENDKEVSQDSLTAVFSESSIDVMHRLNFVLYRNINNVLTNMDGAVICYKNGFSAGKGREDAAKFDNASDNIAITNQNSYSIEGRPNPTTSDSVRLRLWSTTNNGIYQLQIDASGFNYDQVQPYLKDRFTNSQVLLQKGQVNVYNFTATADTNSYNHRFTVVYSSNNVTPLPVQFIQVKASAVQTGVHNISFTTQSSESKRYEVEYASNTSNGQFTSIGTITSKGDGIQSYSYEHKVANPTSTIHYYRIKSIDVQGKEQYSAVVSVQSVDNNSKEQVIRIYPNPVLQRQMQVHVRATVSNQPLKIQVYDQAGKLVFSSMLQHNNAGGNSSYRIGLPTMMASGKYQVEITGKGETERWSQSIIVSTE